MPAARHLPTTQGLFSMLLFINSSLILSLFCLFVPPTSPWTEYPGVCCTPQAAKEKAQSSRDDTEKLQAVETGTGNYRSIYFGQGRSDLQSKPQLPQIFLTASLVDAVQSWEMHAWTSHPHIPGLLEALYSMDYFLHHTPFPGSVVPDHHRWRNCPFFQCLPAKPLCLLRATHPNTHCLERQSETCSGMSSSHGHLIIPTEYYAISKGIDADPQHPSGASINDTSLWQTPLMVGHHVISPAHSPDTIQILNPPKYHPNSGWTGTLCLVLMHIPLARPPQNTAVGIHSLLWFLSYLTIPWFQALDTPVIAIPWNKTFPDLLFPHH